MIRSRNIGGLILFIIIIALLVIIAGCWLFNISLAPQKPESFYSKRNERVRIYQSDEISDPDESSEYEGLDPDDYPMNFDPNH